MKTAESQIEYLKRMQTRFLNAIAWNVSCPQMLEYQRAMLAKIEQKLAALSA